MIELAFIFITILALFLLATLLRLNKSNKLMSYTSSLVTMVEYRQIRLKFLFINYYIRVKSDDSYRLGKKFCIYKGDKLIYCSDAASIIYFDISKRLSYFIILFTITKEDYVNC